MDTVPRVVAHLPGADVNIVDLQRDFFVNQSPAHTPWIGRQRSTVVAQRVVLCHEAGDLSWASTALGAVCKS
jgi:hypothetical protein